ncbi:hypothetical protein LCGC14_0746270 [marine sediment metagenome]|uniref:Uncharacterized protein n=1 Tax=marine sediment metagenome TaxID=412755 RepID=A0A0F9QQ48_9ZZZZ
MVSMSGAQHLSEPIFEPASQAVERKPAAVPPMAVTHTTTRGARPKKLFGATFERPILADLHAGVLAQRWSGRWVRCRRPEALTLRHGRAVSDCATDTGTCPSRTAYSNGYPRNDDHSSRSNQAALRAALGASVGCPVGNGLHGVHGGLHGHVGILTGLRPRQSWVRKRRLLAVGRGSGPRFVESPTNGSRSDRP